MAKNNDYVVKDISLAKQGAERIEWARRHMPVLGLIKDEFTKKKPLKGVNVIACLHVTVETANLIDTLLAGGANVALTASNPLSTQDDVAAALAKKGVKVYAVRGEGPKEYYENIEKALKIKPNVTLDDGADVIATVHSKHKEYLKDIWGGCEETTTGVIRLRAMAKDKALKYPVVAVNDAETKMMFDNRYGTGQSTLHGIINCDQRAARRQEPGRRRLRLVRPRRRRPGRRAWARTSSSSKSTRVRRSRQPWTATASWT